MDLRSAIHQFVEQGRLLIARLRSAEADHLSRVDLHILEVQLYLLGKEVTRRKAVAGVPSLETKQSSANKPDFPPFVLSDERPKAKN
jgi:hypothetical protein